MVLSEPAKMMIEAEPGIAVFGRPIGTDSRTDFFVREESAIIKGFQNPTLVLRPGVVVLGGVVVVMVLFQVGGRVFETWWNYFEDGNDVAFRGMTEQETVTFHFHGEKGKREKSTTVRNPLRGLFRTLVEGISQKEKWSLEEFEKAKEMLCQKYPTILELWEELGRQAQR
jgi:hypothetical protein